MVLLEVLLERDPVVLWRAVLGEALLRRGQARLAGGDPAGSASDWRLMAAIFEKMPPAPEAAFLEACCHAMLAGAAGRGGSGGPSGAGPTEAGRAMDIFHQAVAIGFRGARRYRVEPALGPLRDRHDFRCMVMDLAMPDRPLAPMNERKDSAQGEYHRSAGGRQSAPGSELRAADPHFDSPHLPRPPGSV